MKKPQIAAVLVLLSLLPACPTPGKQVKGGVTYNAKAYKAAKGAKIPPARARLFGNPLYKEAMGFFAKKNYAGALQRLEFLDANGYCCDLGHYYIAQCYQNTNQTEMAERHYGWVASRSKDPTLRYYAEYANQQIAYYSGHRTYAGQGNYFDRGSTGRGGGGGGGGGGGFG